VPGAAERRAPWGFLRAFFRAGFRRYAAYRAATLAGAFTNAMFGLVKASILLAVIHANGGAAVGGYDATTASSYAWLSQATLSVVYVFTWTEVAARVRSGDIAVDLARPVDLQLSLLAADLGRATYSLLPRGLPSLAVGAATFGLTLTTDPAMWLLGLTSLVLAVVVSFACRFAVNLVAFWWVEIRGLMTLYVVATNVLCGLVVPVHWFPDWLRVLATATPFPSMLQTPVDVLGGTIRGAAALSAVAVQLGWAVATLGGGRLLLRRATRKLVVHGG